MKALGGNRGMVAMICPHALGATHGQVAADTQTQLASKPQPANRTQPKTN